MDGDSTAIRCRQSAVRLPTNRKIAITAVNRKHRMPHSKQFPDWRRNSCGTRYRNMNSRTPGERTTAPIAFGALIAAGIIVVLQLFIFQDRLVTLGASFAFAGLSYVIAQISLRGVEVMVCITSTSSQAGEPPCSRKSISVLHANRQVSAKATRDASSGLYAGIHITVH
jgi:hypothetical protein